MVDSIEISFISNFKENNIYINVNDLTISKNGLIKKLSRGTIFRLLKFFTNWKSEYYSSDVIDGEEFIVVVKSGDREDVFKGKGEYPKNYNAFKNFLGGL